MHNIREQIDTLLKKEYILERLHQDLKGTPLEETPLSFSDVDLYGVAGWISFKSSDVSVKDLMDTFELIPTEHGTGNFSYSVPASYGLKQVAERKKTTIQHNRTTEAVAEIGINDYSVCFYGRLGEHVYRINISWMKVIIDNRYPTLATGQKVPHLQENPNWSQKRAAHQPKYHGRNGAESGSYSWGSYYEYGTLAELFL